MSQELLEIIFDNLQDIKTRQLLNEAITREFIEDVSRQFDEIEYQLAAIRKQIDSNRARINQGSWLKALASFTLRRIAGSSENLDTLIEKERKEGLMRRLVIATRKLSYFLEQKSIMGIETSYPIINQIEQAEEEVASLRLQIEELGRKL